MVPNLAASQHVLSRDMLVDGRLKAWQIADVIPAVLAPSKPTAPTFVVSVPLLQPAIVADASDQLLLRC